MDKAEEKRQLIAEEKLNNQYSIKFSLRDLIFIYNVLCSQSYKVGDGKICWDIVQKIEPIVNVAAAQPQVKPASEDKIILSKEKN